MRSSLKQKYAFFSESTGHTASLAAQGMSMFKSTMLKNFHKIFSLVRSTFR